MILASHPALPGRTTGCSLPHPLGAAQKGMGPFEVPTGALSKGSCGVCGLLDASF